MDIPQIEKTTVSKRVGRMFLGLDLSWWNNAMLLSLGLAAFAAIAVVITTRIVITVQDQEAAARAAEFAQYRIAADERISVTEADAEKARAGLAEANAKIADADAIAAQANLKALEAERQNLELREKLGNRRVTAAQHDVLVAELSKSPGSFNIETMGDPESVLYAADIAKTLQDAHWTVDQNIWPLGVMWTGLVLPQTNDPAAAILANALTKGGITWALGDQHRDKATVIVGGRPPYF